MTKQLIDMNDETKARLDSILFRGKSYKSRYGGEGEWVEGHYVPKIKLKDGSVTGHVILTDDWGYHEVIPETVGRFTGLLDADGKRIWEGDVISISHKPPRKSVGVVSWKKEDPMFCINCATYTMHFPLSAKDISIIGNIHDNPDLLK